MGGGDNEQQKGLVNKAIISQNLHFPKFANMTTKEIPRDNLILWRNSIFHRGRLHSLPVSLVLLLLGINKPASCCECQTSIMSSSCTPTS